MLKERMKVKRKIYQSMEACSQIDTRQSKVYTIASGKLDISVMLSDSQGTKTPFQQDRFVSHCIEECE